MTRILHPGHAATLRQDFLIAVLVAVLLVLGSEFAVQDDLWNELPRVIGPLLPRWGIFLLLLAQALPLTLRRITPLPVLASCIAASLGLQAAGRPTPLPLGALVAVYTVAVRQRPLVSVGVAAGYLGLLAAGIATGWAPIGDDLFYTYLVSLIATVSLGYGVALSRARTRLAEAWAAELVREQEDQTRRAVAQEQSRIAREVHDIVAHDVSVIIAQASAARRTLAAQDGDTARSLSSIEAVGRDALDGLRRLVHLLRTERSGTDRSPQPALDRLPWLLAQVRQAGLPVELVVRGTPRPLPATLELNAYRIIQEALTNSLKHAGPTRATVVLGYEGDTLGVEVRDTGAGGHPRRPAEPSAPHGGTGEGPVTGDVGTGQLPGSGYGMISMQQRAALLGGDLVTGPTNGRGFRVAARLPIDGGRP